MAFLFFGVKDTDTTGSGIYIVFKEIIFSLSFLINVVPDAHSTPNNA